VHGELEARSHAAGADVAVAVDGEEPDLQAAVVGRVGDDARHGLAAAAAADSPRRMSSTIKKLPAVRMTASPRPVAQAAPDVVVHVEPGADERRIADGGRAS